MVVQMLTVDSTGLVPFSLTALRLGWSWRFFFMIFMVLSTIFSACRCQASWGWWGARGRPLTRQGSASGFSVISKAGSWCSWGGPGPSQLKSSHCGGLVKVFAVSPYRSQGEFQLRKCERKLFTYRATKRRLNYERGRYFFSSSCGQFQPRIYCRLYCRAQCTVHLVICVPAAFLGCGSCF